MQALEGGILFHFRSWQASDILDDGCRNRAGRIFLPHDRARHHGHFAGLLLDLLQGEEPPPSGNDAVMIAFTAHQQSLADAALAD